MRFKNKGKLVMPVILEFEFKDGTKQVERIPAEIWRFGQESIQKVMPFEKEVVSVRLDPFLETADVDLDNNSWPPKAQPTRFQIYKQNQGSRPNPMQQMKRINDEGQGGK